MCQSKAQGGRRCDIGRTLKGKIDKKEYLEKIGREVPQELEQEISTLTQEHAAYEKHLEEKEQKRLENIKAKEERLARRQERVARKAKQEEEKARKLAEKQNPVNVPVQLYLSPKEAALFDETAATTFIKDKKEKGELAEFLNKAVSARHENPVSYEEWVNENGETPEAYLNSYGMDIKTAAKATRERLYDGVRDKVKGDVPLTASDNYLEQGLQKVKRDRVGRVQSNFGKDNSTRSVKKDLLLTADENARVERIAQIFGISKGDALRNQVTGIDHRIRQPHQSVPKYLERYESFKEYEVEGGKYRKTGETVQEMYSRLISDPNINLAD